MSEIVNISHITFIVKDIEKSSNIFKTLFKAEEIYDSKNKKISLSREKFLLVNGLWIALMEGDSLAEKTYNHIAFKVNKEDLDNYLSKIKQLGLEIKDGRSRIEAEAESIYFYDFDNHLFELHTGTLEQRLGKYLNK